MAKSEFDIDKYVSEICDEIGVKPKDDIFKGSKYSEEGLFLPYALLIQSVIKSNWDPAYNDDAPNILKKESTFNKFLKTADLQSGMPPRPYVIRYFQFAKNYFKHGLFSTNLKHVELLESQINCILDSHLPVLIVGENGVGKRSIGKIIHSYNNRSNAPLEIVDCFRHSDDQLCVAVFGTDKNKGSHDCRATIANAEGGTLFITNLNKSGKYFQDKLYRFLLDGSYTNVDANIENRANVRIICSVESETDNILSEMKSLINPDLYNYISQNSIYLPAIRFVRSNIPLLIYLSILKTIQTHNLEEISLPRFPSYLVRHWYAQEGWLNNFHHLYYLVEKYIKIHSQKGNNYKVINDLPSNDSNDFIFYTNSFEAVDNYQYQHFDFLNTPFLPVALQYIDSRTHQISYRYSAYKDISPFQLDFGYEEYMSALGFPGTKASNNHVPTEKQNHTETEVDEPADQNIWIRKGDKWQIKYQGNEFYLDDHVGVRYIAYLLQNTNTAISCDTLSYLINAPPVDSILDEYSRMSIEELERENLIRLDGMGRPEDPENLLETINKFKAKYLRLGQALKRAKKSGSDNLARKLAVIREQIDDELREITNKYGLPRPELDDFDKARKRVSLRIQDVIDKIRKKKYSKTLPDHLQLFIKKGRYCIYEPMEDTKWEVDF